MSDSEPVELNVSQSGDRVDRYLRDALNLSRSQVKKLLDAQLVTLNGRMLSSSDKGRQLRETDRLEVRNLHTLSEPIAQPELSLTIVSEDDSAIIVDKPINMPVHPLQPGEQNTLLNAIVAKYPRIVGVGEGGLQSGVVHRLDLPTSGTIAFALTEQRWQAMRRELTNHKTKKTYTALVEGRPADHGEMQAHLYVAQHSPARVAVSEAPTDKTRQCSLAWQVLGQNETRSLIEVDLHTGFLHQIRVMFAAIGCPVVGDEMYGSGPAERMMLHATRLEIDGLVGESPTPFAL